MKTRSAIPLLILMVLFLLLMVSWNNTISYQAEKAAEYQNHIDAAEAYLEKRIYIDAVSEYKAALKLKPKNYDLAMKIVSLYEDLEDKSNYLSALKVAIDADPTQEKPYLLLTDHYFSVNNYEEAYKLLTEAQKHLQSEEINSRVIKIKGRYTLTAIKGDNVSSFFYEKSNASTGYAVTESEGKFGLVSSGNQLTMNYNYEAIGLLSDNVIPVCLDGEYYYINSKEQRKLVPDKPAQYLGTFGNGLAPACIGGVYGYLTKKMVERHFEYTYAGCFYNNMAAVQKDGKWAVIDSSFKNIVGFEFDEILMDDNDFCSTYNVFFAKKDGKYALYNKEGKELAGDFEDARVFASAKPAAVKINGKWGFISRTGEMVIEPRFEEAQSFCIGYAPFCKDGKWGCIDENGIVVIEPTFDYMQPFARNGYAQVDADGVKKYVCVTVY